VKKLTHKAFWGMNRTWCGLSLSLGTGAPLGPNIEYVTCADCKVQYAAFMLSVAEDARGDVS
jgi:hypothetical protein